MSKKIKRTPQKIVYIVAGVVALGMLAFTNSVFRFIADLYVKPCPEYTEFGACKLEYGLSASAMGTAAAVMWVIIALTTVFVSLYKLKRSIK